MTDPPGPSGDAGPSGDGGPSGDAGPGESAALDVVRDLGARLAHLGWVTDLLVAGSLATGDHRPGVSDLDLVALTAGAVGPDRQAELTALHRELDAGPARGAHLGCVYVDAATAGDPARPHPTWTHGQLVQRILSGITRAELVRHGFAVSGRPPGELFPAVTGDDVRAAARAELAGYWTWAARRPWLWRDPDMADLSLTSMARARYAIEHGDLLTKTRAVELAHAPPRLIAGLRARRRGEAVVSPRLRTALVAWWDTRRTTAALRAPHGPG